MPEYWEIIATTPEQIAHKCANIGCRIYCDFANKCVCPNCDKIYCIKCRLPDTHKCKEYITKIEERNNKTNSLLYDDLSKYEDIHKSKVAAEKKMKTTSILTKD